MAKTNAKSAPSLSSCTCLLWDRLNMSRTVLVIYVALVIYGSLYPFSGWNWARGGLRVLLTSFSLKHAPRADLVINVAIYIPVGLLIIRAWPARAGTAARIAAAVLCGVALSTTMEYLQSYLPTRVSSLVDVTTNGIGTLLGALLAHGAAPHSATGLRLQRARDQLFLPGRMIDLGLMVLALWTLWQLMPIAPSFDHRVYGFGVHPVSQAFLRYVEFQRPLVVVYALNIAAAGIIASELIRPERPVLPLFAVWLGPILACKLLLVKWELAPEMLIGAGTGLLLLALLPSTPKGVRLWTAVAMVVAGFIVAQLHGTPYPYATQFAMNWIPFRNQLEGRTGLEDIIENMWPFAALAYLALLIRPRRPRTEIAAGGGLLVLILSLTIERLQTHLPDHHPDVTETGLAVLGWALPWIYALRSKVP